MKLRKKIIFLSNIFYAIFNGNYEKVGTDVSYYIEKVKFKNVINC